MLASMLVAAGMPALLIAAMAHRTCLVDSDINSDLASLLEDQIHREGLAFLEALVKTHQHHVIASWR